MPNGSAVNRTAILYTNGEKSEVLMENGKFNVSIQPKQTVCVVLNVLSLKAPKYAKFNYVLNGSYPTENTVSEHENGKIFVLRMSPESYYAYIYVTETEDEALGIRVIYTGTAEKKSLSV